MINNEIKSCNAVISLKNYLRLKVIPTDDVRLGDTIIRKFNNILMDDVTHTRVIGKLLYASGHETDYVVIENGDLFKKVKIDEINIVATIVLKEQIKDLKYVEQLNLFPEDGKDKNSDIK